MKKSTRLLIITRKRSIPHIAKKEREVFIYSYNNIFVEIYYITYINQGDIQKLQENITL